VKVAIYIVVVAVWLVDTTYVVMFEKVNAKVRFTGPIIVAVVAYQVVTITVIGFNAGALVGRRSTSPERIRQLMTIALTRFLSFMSVPSTCWV
jgi:hypothetical protein